MLGPGGDKIDGADFPYVNWYHGSPKVGLEVYAAGFPLGDPEYTLTKGIVSKANAQARPTGLRSKQRAGARCPHQPGQLRRPTGGQGWQGGWRKLRHNNNNQYFAIAQAEADTVLAELKDGTDVNSIGVNGQVVISEDQNLSGVWVSSVKSGSPADKSGVKAGDIIFQMEGLVLGTDGTMADYCQILRSHKSSDTLSLKVLRWESQEILEGQLNGRQLAVTGSFGGGTTNNNNNNNKNTTAIVVDDSKVIAMEVPSDWQYDGSNWKNTWNINGKAYPFTAQSLTVSPDVKAYNSGWSKPGLLIATSRDWASMGGYANLLAGVAGGYKDCQPAAAQAYKDDVYEGQIMVYSRCGPKQTAALVMAVRPITAPTAYLVLIEMKYTSDAELNLLDAILTSAEINP